MLHRIATKFSALMSCLAAILLLCPHIFSQSPPADAMSLFQQHRWAEAANEFDNLEKAQPGKTDALLLRAKCLVNLNQFTEAAIPLEKYLAVHPQSDDASYLLAYLRFRQDKPKESLDLYTQAAKLKPPSADDLKIVALNYVLLNDYSDAARYLELALKMDPGNSEALYHLGRVLYQQNRFDEAIAAFEEVLKREPGNEKAQDNLGLSLEGKNDVDAAIAAYQKAITLDRAASLHSEQPYFDLGIVLAKSNKPSEAISPLQSAKEINPTSAKVRYELGKTYFTLGQFESARGEAEEAARLNPQDAPCHYLLGRIYHRLGKQDLESREFGLTQDLMRAKSHEGSGMGSGSNVR